MDRITYIFIGVCFSFLVVYWTTLCISNKVEVFRKVLELVSKRWENWSKKLKIYSLILLNNSNRILNFIREILNLIYFRKC